MSRTNWARVADREFFEMDKDYQEDWEELRERVSA